MIYIRSVIVVLIVVVLFMELYLLKSITHTKETVYSCPIDTVYDTVVNNQVRQYRKSLDEFRIEGHWKGEFYSLENDRTRFIATEHLVYKNAIARIKGYIFLNIDKFMEMYQSELRAKVE